MVEKGRRLAELRKVMTKLPQVLLNVGVREKKAISRVPAVRQKIAVAEKELAGRGRILVRYSGTEPLARIMLEGENEEKIRQMAQEIAEEIRLELGSDK
jgi:phosphoglucosamine mutase